MQAGATSAPAASSAKTSGVPGVVAVENLVRRFGERRALSGVSFELAAGDSLCIFGPNGAGKSTLLRVLAGLLRPSSGRVLLNGVPMGSSVDARARVGYIAHASMLYGALTAQENVEFVARMYGLRNPADAALAVLQRMGVSEYARRPVRTLSRGMQQRVSIARALVHAPVLLLLDEPFSGLDEVGSRLLSGMLRELRTAGATMIVVTHNITEGLSLSRRCSIMLNGAFARMDDSASVDAPGYAELYYSLATHGA